MTTHPIHSFSLYIDSESISFNHHLRSLRTLPGAMTSNFFLTHSNAYPRRVSQRFLDIFHDLAIEQMVDFTTRNLNTLDLVLTSHPAFMTRCSRLPPLGAKSDHDIVLYDTTHEAVRTRQPCRKILLWKMLTRTPPSKLALNFASHSKVRLFPQSMIC